MDVEGDFRELDNIFSGLISSYSYMSRDSYESERYVTGSEGVEKGEFVVPVGG